MERAALPSSVRYSSISDKLFLRRYPKAHPGLWVGIMAVFGVCNHVLFLEKSCLLEPVLLLKVSHLHKRALLLEVSQPQKPVLALKLTVCISMCFSWRPTVFADAFAAPKIIPPAEVYRSILSTYVSAAL